MRERLEKHRANPVCASCHRIMDPIGFAMENFDAVGAWRAREGGTYGSDIDASGVLLDGTPINGVSSLRQALLQDPEIFVGTVVEKLMIYSLGRGVSPADMPTVRADGAQFRPPELSLLVDCGWYRRQRGVPDAHRGGAGVGFRDRRT